MAGSIIENLSGRKLSILISLLMICQLLCFLIGGLIGPAPTSVMTALRRICLDKNYDENKWYYTRGKGSCHIINSINTPEITNQHDISGNNLVFVFQIPLPKDNIELDFSRWQQNMIAMLVVDIPINDDHSDVTDAILTIDARLGYKNKNETKWKELAKSVEDRRLSCEPPENKNSESVYKCNPIPLYELGSIHHDYYLLNLRFPNYIKGYEKEVNRLDIDVNEVHMINGGFTKVWVSLKTVFFPCIIAIMFWFWNRISQLSRPAALLEYMLMCLGGALTFLNVPLEYLSLFVDCPWMTLVGDIRQGLFYAALLSFWLIFAGEHLMDDTERNRIQVYWRHLSAVLTGCLCLFIFDMCERGVQLKNPFYSIWATEIGTNLALAFIIIAGICAGLYFCFLSFMVYKVFLNISSKRKSLPAMASSRRLKYEGIIYRFKVLMLATLLCAAVTVIAFIMGQIIKAALEKKLNLADLFRNRQNYRLFLLMPKNLRLIEGRDLAFLYRLVKVYLSKF
ncbi:Protein wntless [Armadillidium vulgare]|nr:Protein wntless [Armadillidium vulgare]